MLVKSIKNFLVHLFGTSTARENQKKDARLLANFDSAITSFEQLLVSKTAKSHESPIFVFSAGWRSGSTLLQRILCSSEGLFLWGEPYDKSNIVTNMAKTMRPFASSWPMQEYLKQPEDINQIADKWIANLYPSADKLKNAHLSFFDALFAEPAKELGAKRWGIKEVRFGVMEALFLKWLYPNAKFLFVYRNLFDAYFSYKNFCPSMDWYGQWPEKNAFTPYTFAKHRSRLLKEFKAAQAHTGGLLFSYEDMITGNFNLDEIDQYCGVSVNKNTLKIGVGSGTSKSGANRIKTNQWERMLLRLGDR